MTEARGPRRLSALFRRLLPGPLGAEACDELDRQHAERRTRGGPALAWLWYAAHLLRTDTWALAAALRRRSRVSGKGSARRGRASAISALDVKLGLRMLGKHAGLSVISGLAIAVSIAIGAGCFSFLQDYMARPDVPLPEGDRVVSLGLRNAATNRTERDLLHDFVVWREDLRSVQDVGAWREVTRNLVAPDGTAEPVRVAEMTASGFRVARVPPLLGRPLLDADEAEGAAPVAVIGYGLWRDRFEGDPDVVGRTLQLGRTPHTVVGVMPEGFGFPLSNDLWVPLRWDPDDHGPLAGSGRAFAFGRLAPGATMAEAQAEMSVITQRRAAELPGTHEHVRGQVMHYTDTHTGMDDVTGGLGLMLFLALSFITLILTVPFVNVAILVYARTARRSGEIALRNALGATRRRLVTQLFIEALVLSGLAAAAGVALALFGLGRAQDLMALEFGGAPFWAKQGRDPATVAYAAGLAVLAAVVAGVIPGLKATGKGVQSNLARQASGNGMRMGRTWTALVVVQVATTVAVLPPAVSLAWQGLGEGIVEPTFAAHDLLAARIQAPPGEAAPSAEGAPRTPSLAEVLRRLREDPAVTALTYASDLPASAFVDGAFVEVEGGAPPERGRGHRVGDIRVADDFFEVLDVPVLAGRGFRRGDAAAESRPIVVNHTFVRGVLADADAVGRRVRFLSADADEPGPWHEIVGVVGDLTRNPVKPDQAKSRVFRPMPDDGLSGATLVLRVSSTPEQFAPRLRRTVVAVDPALRLHYATPVADFDDPLRSTMRMVALGIGVALLSVLLLATAGVYALMSFNVTRRRREIGIRSALGAHPRRVLADIFSRAALQLGAGAAVGLAIAVPLQRALVRGLDELGTGPGPGLVVVVAALMVAVGLASTVGPARRGLAVEPSEALREG